MLVRIGVQFSVKEARALVAEINSLRNQDRVYLDPDGILFGIPNLEKLKKRLENPLVEEIKIEAQPPQQEDTHA